MANNELMDKIVSLAKRRGFIYPGSEIYGGLANTYDYGPLGTELLRNIKDLWWKYFVQTRSDMVGLDASIISHSRVWQASGHVAGFADAMIDCKNCKARMRADHLIENALEKNVEGSAIEELEKFVKENEIKCPNCGKNDWTAIRKFNQLFPVQLGIVEGEGGSGYLRGETAQGIFINFKNVVDSTRVRLPFGIGQIGKAFRNEITPGNSVFRTIEFEAGEIEYFFDPQENNWEELYEKWKNSMWDFATKILGINAEKLRWRTHPDQERSFYSTRTEDLEYEFPFSAKGGSASGRGFKELWGIAYRTDYDLTQHMNLSKKDLSIVDPMSGRKIVPHVIEPAVGINRLLLMVLIDSYTESDPSAGSGQGRIVLNLHPKLAPYKVAVFPLLANKENLVEKARGIYDELKQHFMVSFDDRGNIGKRYLYQDEIGTPWCVTVDFESLDDEAVTVRDRITTKQERVAIKDLVNYFSSKLV